MQVFSDFCRKVQNTMKVAVSSKGKHTISLHILIDLSHKIIYSWK